MRACVHFSIPSVAGMWGGFSQEQDSRTKKVKKEGPNQDRLFYCCPHPRESACDFFEWKPDEDPLEPGCVCLFSMPPSYRYTVRKTGETFTSKETDS